MTELDWALVAFSGLLGLAVGSFANVAIQRWPRSATVLEPRSSVCPNCGTHIMARDNVPLVSWLILRGRCRHCGERIAARYPLVELATAVLFAAVALVHGLDWLLPTLLVFTWALVVATVIDLEHRIIPNRLTFRLAPILLVGVVVAAWQANAWVDLRRAIIAGIAVPALMLLLSETFRIIRGQAGIGMGDIKLAVSIGLVVGYLGGWELVIFAYGTMISGVVIALGLMLVGKAKMATRIPYGPYLAVGALLAVLFGEPLSGALAAWFGV